MKRIETEVAIIGSGCAGSAAACAAAELGLQVAVFEKSAELGGPIKGANGPFAVGSHMQRDRQMTFSPADALKLLVEHTHGKVDARLAAEYFNKSASTIAWLEEKGVKFNDVVAYFRGAEYTWHHKDPASPNITDALLGRAKALGAQIHVETTVTSLKKEGDRVVGLMAETATGETVEVFAKAVIIASGGFGGNPELIKQYTGYDHGHNLFSFSFPQVQGEGLKMAWAAGAGQSPMMMQTYVCLPAPFWGPGGTPPHLGSFRQPNLMVNIQGERFMNEELMANPAFAANAVGRQKGGHAYMIFDETTNLHYENNDWDFIMSRLPVTRSHQLGEAIAKARAEGFEHLFAVNTLEQLAAETGIDLANLTQTVAEYNAACDIGRDALFHKSSRYLRPLRQPRFYVARFYLGGYGSLGGIKINHRTQVLTEEQDIIPGLYAIGRDANALYGDTYCYAMSGNDTAFDFNAGRMAAENIAKSLRKV